MAAVMSFHVITAFSCWIEPTVAAAVWFVTVCWFVAGVWCPRVGC